MLVRLFAKNYGVFRDGFDLSLEATDLGTDEDRGYFEVPIDGENRPLKLLRLIAIYGPNGSGKSTVIAAASQLFYLAVESGPRGQEGERISGYDPFRFDPSTSNAPCALGCEVVVDGKIVNYTVEFDGEIITQETVIEYRKSGDHVWLKRDKNSVTILDERLKSEIQIDLNDVTRANATVLSVAAQLNQKPLLPLFHAMHTSLTTLISDGVQHGSLDYSLTKLHSDPQFKNWVLERLLKPADIGIRSIGTKEHALPKEVVKIMSDISKAANVEMPPEIKNIIEPMLSHSGVDNVYGINFARESTGTRKILALAGPWFDVVHSGLTLFADELSASLHPTLLTALLDALNPGPSHSPSQLVFTVHDPSPLEHTLRRDQVYFTEKNDSGVASLFSLSEFKERPINNIRKRYLEGRYGAIPRVLDFNSIFEPMDDS